MTRTATLLLASASVSACAPLSQAGLVYASRGQAGVTIAAGTPETPGLDLNIGMRTSDFAYIPVVVGRPCEFSRLTNCDQALIRVFGTHNLTSETPNERGDSPSPSPPAPGQPKAMSRSSNNQDDGTVAEQPAAAERSTDQIINALGKLLNTNSYQDSYSVFGTFNSTGNASAPATGGNGTAGLSLGRVFSTGVAAQHLTDGQYVGQRAQAYTQCLAAVTNAVKDVTPADAQNTLRQELLRGCATAQTP